MTNKVIAITLYRRPKYTQLLLDSLASAYGIEDYHIIFSCDYSPQYNDACMQCKDLAEGFNAGKSKQVIQHTHNLTAPFNVKFAMEEAFKLSDYVVYLEEDVAVAKDALRYFEFCGKAFKDNPKVVSVCAYNRYTDPEYHQRIYTEHPYSLEFFPGKFCFWGLGMWKDRWDSMMAGYYPNYPSGLDFWITEHLQPGQGCYRILLSRVQCTGGEDAVHTPSDAWHRENEFNALGAWDFDMPDPDPNMWIELVNSSILRRFQEAPMGETLKAKERRLRYGFFDKYCQGRGIDIGCGDDPLTLEVDRWDIPQGDATYVVGIEPETYDFVYTSHLLEHLFYPVVAIQNWWKTLKTGGYLIIVVPHKELYERRDCLVPPLGGDRHKMFFLPDRADPPHTLSLLDTVNLALGAEPREFIYMMMCDEGRIAVDEVTHPQGEYQIELVIRKGQRPRFGDVHLADSPI